jgi:AraC-like DNA-binding protein
MTEFPDTARLALRVIRVILPLLEGRPQIWGDPTSQDTTTDTDTDTSVDAGPVVARGEAVKAKAFIDGHFREEFDVEGLARLVHLSPKQLRTVFKAAYGVSPRDYHQTRRVLAMTRELRTTRVPVAEVAAHAGWSDRRAATARFRTATGQTPTEYRATHT